MTSARFCPKCNTETERYKGGKCKPCDNAISAAYRAANLEKVLATQAAYRVANAVKVNASRAAYRVAHPERVAAAKAAWNVANRERVAEYQAEYRVANHEKIAACDAKRRTENGEKIAAANAKWRAANPGKAAASKARWKIANREKCRAYNHTRRASKRGAGGVLSPGLAAKLFNLQRGKCACGCKQPLGDDYHIDHRMPFALGGSNTDDNIQLLTATCNLQKQAKHPIDFMQQRGFLL